MPKPRGDVEISSPPTGANRDPQPQTVYSRAIYR